MPKCGKMKCEFMVSEWRDNCATIKRCSINGEVCIFCEEDDRYERLWTVNADLMAQIDNYVMRLGEKDDRIDRLEFLVETLRTDNDGG